MHSLSMPISTGTKPSDGSVISLTYPKPGESITCDKTHNTYSIGSVIGEGNFGIVYGCRDIWGNDLAVKVLKPKGTYQSVRKSYLKELEKLARFRHPHITYVYDAFEFRNAFYIVTERCTSTLAIMLNAPNFNGQYWLRPVAHCILQAVNFIHTNGYLHQDIHVGNVLSTFIKDEMLPKDKGRQALVFKLGDLGISRLIEEVSSESTMAEWMRPPEVLDSKRFGKPDHRVDIYHIGLMLLQMMLGCETHFSSDEILSGKPCAIASGWHIPVGDVIARALSCNINNRTSSAMSLWKELDAVLPKM